MFDRRTLHFDQPHFRPHSAAAYAVAGSIIVLAALLQLNLNAWADQTPYLTFFPSVVVVVFLCGSAAGCLAIFLSVLSAWLLIFSLEIDYMSVYRTMLFCIGSFTVVGIVAVMRAAATHIRQSNESLRVSEEKFRGLLESAPDAIIIVDSARRINLINARTESLFGYQRTDLLGETAEFLLSADTRERYRAQLEEFLECAPSASVIDLVGVRKDGAAFPIEVSLGAIRTEGGIEISHAIRDISAHKEVEKGLAQASNAKSQFLANMSHELRTPLNAIIGFSEIIRDGIIGPLDARYREYGADINQSAQHLRDVINGVLDISRIEASGLELRDDIVSLSEVAEACGRIVAAMAATAEVALEVDIPALMPSLRVDQLRLQQVLLNLMSNAVKFTPRGGHVRVSARLEARGAVIVVEDSGIGMKPEEIPVALEPFRQIDGVLSRRFDGTGLGLPLAKALIELQGGRLEIESAPGIGTKVYICLPPERVVRESQPED